jgi:hypothetical protein
VLKSAGCVVGEMEAPELGCLAIFGWCGRYKGWLYGVSWYGSGEDDRDVERKTTLTGSRTQSLDREVR